MMPLDDTNSHRPRRDGGGSGPHSDLIAFVNECEAAIIDAADTYDKCMGCSAYLLGVKLLSKWLAHDTARRVISGKVTSARDRVEIDHISTESADILAQILIEYAAIVVDVEDGMRQERKNDD